MPRSCAPVARIAERHFFVADAVPHERRPQVQMAGDDGAGAEAARPVLGARGAAPDREARNPRRPRQVVPKRPVIDEHGARRRRGARRAAPRSASHARVAPGGAIDGHGSGRASARRRRRRRARAPRPPRDRPGRRRAGSCSRRAGTSARSNVPGSPGHSDVRILGRQHAGLAADGDQLVVARLAARAVGCVGRAPEIVIAGRPDRPARIAAPASRARIAGAPAARRRRRRRSASRRDSARASAARAGSRDGRGAGR